MGYFEIKQYNAELIQHSIPDQLFRYVPCPDPMHKFHAREQIVHCGWTSEQDVVALVELHDLALLHPVLQL